MWTVAPRWEYAELGARAGGGGVVARLGKRGEGTLTDTVDSYHYIRDLSNAISTSSTALNIASLSSTRVIESRGSWWREYHL